MIESWELVRLNVVDSAAGKLISFNFFGKGKGRFGVLETGIGSLEFAYWPWCSLSRGFCINHGDLFYLTTIRQPLFGQLVVVLILARSRLRIIVYAHLIFVSKLIFLIIKLIGQIKRTLIFYFYFISSFLFKFRNFPTNSKTILLRNLELIFKR
jgi:hypothetical protein